VEHACASGQQQSGEAVEGSAREGIVDHGRHETREEQADRNWNELLQELRVMQTGTQILVAFLFTIPFQPSFKDLDDIQRGAYLVLVLLAAAMTVLLLTPISLHRGLFRRRLKRKIVEHSAAVVRAALVGTALLAAGGAALVFDVVMGRTAGVTVLIALTVTAVLLWFAYPAIVGRDKPNPPKEAPHNSSEA
jgi:RsiW-degrading membrane proteinase PrsW (M82 family)